MALIESGLFGIQPAPETILCDKMSELGPMTIQNIKQFVEILSGGQSHSIAIAFMACANEAPVTA